MDLGKGEGGKGGWGDGCLTEGQLIAQRIFSIRTLQPSDSPIPIESTHPSTNPFSPLLIRLYSVPEQEQSLERERILTSK
jgi:hypothetical protein